MAEEIAVKKPRKPRQPVIKKEIEPMIDLTTDPVPAPAPVVKEDFMTSKWRPMMAISYMAICLFDFMVGPILYNVLQYMNPGQHLEMWQAVTLQGGGLYHLSMGAIIGITAFGRTKEKMAETKE
jgi:fucose 4-O-acetylase-like acetyltransferase